MVLRMDLLVEPKNGGYPHKIWNYLGPHWALLKMKKEASMKDQSWMKPGEDTR